MESGQWSSRERPLPDINTYQIYDLADTSNDVHNKADWSKFQALTHVADYEDDSIDSMVDKIERVESFNTLLHSAALLSILRTTGSTRISPVPWWSREWENAIKAKKAALRGYQHTRSMVDKIEHKRARAYARRIQRTSRKESWQKYISSINTNTIRSKIWKRIQKVKGKYSGTGPSRISYMGRDIMAPQEVATLLAEHYQHITSSNNYFLEFLAIKNVQEQRPLNFIADWYY